MKFTKYIMIFSLVAGCSLAQAQQRPFYKAKPLTPEDISRKQRIPEWLPPTIRAVQNLPAGVNNGTLKYFPSVFNQLGNSCSQASGVRYVFTYEVNRMLDRDAKASRENVFSYHFTWNYLNNGMDEGSHPELGYDMMKVGGAATLDDMPDESAAVSTTTWLTGYEKYLRAMTYRVKSYEKFSLKTTEGIQRLKQYLYNRGVEGSVGGLVTFSCYSGDWKEYSYKGPSVTGLKDMIVKNGTDGAHALTIVGYDDTVEYDFNGDGKITDDEKGAFIFVNSWGTWWASEGFCYYPYKLFLTPASEGGLADMSAMALMVEPEVHEPKVVFKVNLTYTSRNDLFFRLGVADGENATSPTVIMGYPMMQNQGGDFYMRGEGTAEAYKTIEVGMNFTDKLPEFENFKNPKFFLVVRKIAMGKVGDGQINSFSVMDYRTGKEYVCEQKNVKISGETILATGDQKLSEVSANPNGWLQTSGNGAVKSPFILRTADGKQIKLQFEEYNKESGQVRIKYQKLP